MEECGVKRKMWMFKVNQSTSGCVVDESLKAMEYAWRVFSTLAYGLENISYKYGNETITTPNELLEIFIREQRRMDSSNKEGEVLIEVDLIPPPGDTPQLASSIINVIVDEDHDRNPLTPEVVEYIRSIGKHGTISLLCRDTEIGSKYTHGLEAKDRVTRAEYFVIKLIDRVKQFSDQTLSFVYLNTERLPRGCLLVENSENKFWLIDFKLSEPKWISVDGQERYKVAHKTFPLKARRSFSDVLRECRFVCDWEKSLVSIETQKAFFEKIGELCSCMGTPEYLERSEPLDILYSPVLGEFHHAIDVIAVVVHVILEDIKRRKQKLECYRVIIPPAGFRGKTSFGKEILDPLDKKAFHALLDTMDLFVGFFRFDGEKTDSLVVIEVPSDDDLNAAGNILDALHIMGRMTPCYHVCYSKSFVEMLKKIKIKRPSKRKP